jgi:hypothetical protein
MSRLEAILGQRFMEIVLLWERHGIVQFDREKLREWLKAQGVSA